MQTEKLTPKAVQQALATQVFGQQMHCLDCVDSTNEAAKRLAAQGAPDGTVVTAERQTAGKGRLGRQWHSEADGGLYFSLLLRQAHLPANAAQAALLSGLAVCSAIRGLCQIDAKIKWPNDVVIGGKKLCGILCEAAFAPGQEPWVVAGIGVNVNNQSFPQALAARASSLLLASGAPQSRAKVLRAILEAFEPLCGQQGLPPAYRALCVSLGRQVHFERGGKLCSGVAVDVAPSGELIVALDGGGFAEVGSGEVTVQGIYGA